MTARRSRRRAGRNTARCIVVQRQRTRVRLFHPRAATQLLIARAAFDLLLSLQTRRR